MDGSLTSALGVGFLLGLRHALDADHVAAISTFLDGNRTLYRSCVVGTFWGIGHTLTLFVVALLTIALRLRIPPEVGRVLEVVVGIVVVALGANVLFRALRALRVHRHEHMHDGASHRHLHVHLGSEGAHGHVHLIGTGRRPLMMGALHGLAGSAALLLLVLATIPSTLAALLYVAVFGVGSTVGMLLVSGLIGIPFALSATSQRFRVALRIGVGVASLAVGTGMLAALAGG
jgi:ABC-type nickel/cobalt efflux system permease component RcnA